jgi:uncharacterized repeat protein (TIGR01451 family)
LAVLLSASATFYHDGLAQKRDTRGKDAPVKAQPVELPVLFMENIGQFPPRVRYQHRAFWGTVDVERSGLVFHVSSVKYKGDPRAVPPGSPDFPSMKVLEDRFRLRVLGAGRMGMPRGEKRLRARGNRYAGPDPSRQWTGIPVYSGVVHSDVRPGITFRLGGERGRLCYEVSLAPNADLGDFRFQVEGARGIRVDPSGFAEIATAAGKVRLGAPRFVARDPRTGRMRKLSGKYTLTANRIGFACHGRRGGEALVIDPEIAFGTFPQSLEDWFSFPGLHLAAEGADRVYLSVGVLPYTPGEYPPEGVETIYAYRVVDPSDPELLYVTELVEMMYVNSLTTDGMGRLYAAGNCRNTILPTTGESFQPTAVPDLLKIAVVSLDTEGILDTATYIGELDQVEGFGIIYRGRDVAVMRRADGSEMVGIAGSVMIYSESGGGMGMPPFSYNGPGGASPTAYAGGSQDAFFACLSSGLDRLLWCELRGGGGFDRYSDVGTVDEDFVAMGESNSVHFPTTPGAFQSTRGAGLDIGGEPFGLRSDLILTRYSSEGSIGYSTYLGGPSDDTWQTFAVTPSGGPIALFKIFDEAEPSQTDVYFVLDGLSADGSTLRFAVPYANHEAYVGLYYAVGSLSDGIPVTAHAVMEPLSSISPDAFDAEHGGWTEALYTLRDRETGVATYQSYLGGGESDLVGDLAVAADDGVWMCGETTSPDFPHTTEDPEIGVDGSVVYLVKIARRPYTVGLEKSDSPDPALVNNPITYTLAVTNVQGNVVPVGALKVIDRIPDGMTFQTLPPGSAILSPHEAEIPIPSLEPGETSDLPITVIAGEPGVYVNRARLVFGGETLAEADESTEVLPATVAPDLVLTLTGPPMIQRGGVALYDCRLRNLGGGPAVQTTVVGTSSDAKKLRITRVDDEGATFTATAFRWELGTLHADADETLVLTAQAGDYAGTEQLEASVTTASLPGAVNSAIQNVVIEGVQADVAVEPYGGPWTAGHPVREFSIFETTGAVGNLWPITVQAEFEADLTWGEARLVTLTAPGVFPEGYAVPVQGTTYRWAVPIILNPQAGLPVIVSLRVPEEVADAIEHVTMRVMAPVVVDTNPDNNSPTVALQ